MLNIASYAVGLVRIVFWLLVTLSFETPGQAPGWVPGDATGQAPGDASLRHRPLRATVPGPSSFCLAPNTHSVHSVPGDTQTTNACIAMRGVIEPK